MSIRILARGAGCACCLAATLATTVATAQVYRQAAPQQQPQYAAPQQPGAMPAYRSVPVAASQAGYLQPVRPANGVRPVQFEEAADGQPAAQPTAQPAAQPTAQPVSQSVPGATSAPLPSTVPSAIAEGLQPGEHPLMPALRWARQGMEDINKIQDYSCTLVKRERINGTLGEHEYMFVKVRHQPFSVYTYFLGPARVKGQEALYVDGQNGGSLLAHANGLKHRLIGTVSLKPTSPIAMTGNKYPITEMGMRRLLERLIEIGSEDVKYGECDVTYLTGVKVNDRVCTRIEVVHPVPRRNFLFNIARIYVDDEMQLPIRYEAYEWPERPGEPPVLTEEYTFLNVKVNNNFTDLDFSVDNPNYGFK